MVLLAFLALASSTHASSVGSPVSKVFEMLGSLQAKIIKEGEEAQKAYDEFSEWCQDRHTNVGFEIKTGKAEVEDLQASIEKETSKASALGTKIEELSGSIAKDEADLSAATDIRNQEAADFAAEEKESKEVISTLERAIAVLSRKAAAMMQFKSSGDIVKALSAMVEGSMLSSSDASRLTALVQNKQALLFFLVIGAAAGFESEASWKAEPVAAIVLAVFAVAEGYRMIYTHCGDIDTRMEFDPWA